MQERREEDNIQRDMKTGVRCQGCRELGSIQWWAWVLAALILLIAYQEATASVDSAYCIGLCSLTTHRNVLYIELTTLQILHCAVGNYKPVGA